MSFQKDYILKYSAAIAISSSQSIREIGRDLTQSYDKKTYTHKNNQKET